MSEIPRGEQSENEKIKERLETKLYVPRDVKGEPNREELKIVRDIEKELSKHSSFIGIAPFGSIISGHSIKDWEYNPVEQKIYESDIDLYVLCDNSKFRDEKDYLDFAETLKNTCLEESEKNNRKKIQAILEIISIQGLIRDIKHYFDGNIEGFPETKLAEMSRVITGKKIEFYRKQISDELQKLSISKQQEAVDKITESLVRRDEISLSKRKKRMPELTKREHEEILEKRKEMWQRRVQKVWGLSEK